MRGAALPPPRIPAVFWLEPGGEVAGKVGARREDARPDAAPIRLGQGSRSGGGTSFRKAGLGSSSTRRRSVLRPGGGVGGVRAPGGRLGSGRRIGRRGLGGRFCRRSPRPPGRRGKVPRPGLCSREALERPGGQEAPAAPKSQAGAANAAPGQREGSPGGPGLVAPSPRCLAGLPGGATAVLAGAEELVDPAASATFPREKLGSSWEKRLLVSGFLCRPFGFGEGGHAGSLAALSVAPAGGGAAHSEEAGLFPPVVLLRAAETLE